MHFTQMIGAFIFRRVEVVQKDGKITIYNVGKFYKELVEYATKYYGNKKLYTILFKKSGSAIEFPCFYLIEFMNILKVVRGSVQKYGIRRFIDDMESKIKQETWYKDTLVEPPAHLLDLTNLKNFKLTPLDEQLKMLQYIDVMIPKRKLRGYLLGSPPGTGKAMPLTTPIKTPSGWIKMGDIKVGDTVIAYDRTPSKVLNVYPQGKTEVYELTFKDGRTAKASPDHLWAVYENLEDTEHKVKSTSELISYMKETDEPLYIPLIPSDGQYIKRRYSRIHPWALGYIVNSMEYRNDKVFFKIHDKSITGQLEKYLYPKLKIRYIDDDPIIVGDEECLDELKNTVLSFQTITNSELHSSKSMPGNIFEFINGMIEYGGYITKSGRIHFKTHNESLATLLCYLIRSIGGLAKIDKENEHCVVDIIYKYPKQLFSHLTSERKHRIKNIKISNMKLEIVDIKQVDDDYTQCIEIDHPSHLYVANDFIVTHNTFMDLAFAECITPPVAAQVKIIISPKNAILSVWKKHLDTIYKRKVSYWVSDTPGQQAPVDREFYIFHYEALDRALILAKTLVSRNVRYVVIVDESHNFNEVTSKRSQLVIQLCNLRKDIYSLWASGTPFKALGTEMFTILRCIDNFFTPDVMIMFRRTFGGNSLTKESYDIVSNRISRFLYKIPKEAVVTGVAKPIYEKIYVKIPNSKRFLSSTIKEEMSEFIQERLQFYNQHMKKYNDRFNEILNYHYTTLKTNSQRNAFKQYCDDVKKLKSSGYNRETNRMLSITKKYEDTILIPSLPNNLKKEFREIKTVVKSVASKVIGEALGRIYVNRRIQAGMELAKHFDMSGIINDSVAKTLVYSSYVDVILTVKEKLTQQGYHVPIIYAKTNQNLTKIIDDFAKKDLLNPLVTTFKSLSTAVPMTMANTIIMLDVPVRQYLFDQTISRIYRLNQKKQIYVYQIYIDTKDEPNITTRIDDILEWSRDQISILVGEEFSGKDENVITTTMDGE